MNSHFTRSQQQIMESVPSYNTRLQSRIRDTISSEFSEDIQQMNGAYNIRIDFDEASKEWNANKRRVGQSYEYVCGATTRNGKNCQKKPLNNYTHCNTHS
tara:strand:+ start:82 stop:381 length:300 start_codon:yes stop_codon:yes gene_type:complete